VTSSRLMGTERGKTSPSFVIGIVAVLVMVGGYALWLYASPDHHGQSEQVVRESRRLFNAEVRKVRVDAGTIVDQQEMDAAAKMAALDELGETAFRAIDGLVDQALVELADFDIALRTHKNRSDRLSELAELAKEMVRDDIAQVKGKLASG
jgi:hypothetical protein